MGTINPVSVGDFIVVIGKVPSAPAGFTDAGPTGSDQNVSWTASAGATSYNIYLAEEGGGYVLWTTAAAADTTKTLTGLASSTNYQGKIMAVNSYGESADSNVISFTSQ
jgi:cellulose 1,4-beta-cellobiosidase